MIKAAIIGLGNIAWKYDANLPSNPYALSQAGAILNAPGVELVGACSPDAIERKMFSEWSPGVPTFETPGPLLAGAPDLVGICSPTELHYQHVKMCLASGVRMIWLEKPPTTNTPQLIELIQDGERHKATICVNYIRRYLSQYQKLKKIINERIFGKTVNIRITYSPGLARNGIHMLDQLFYLTNATGYEILWIEKDGDKTSPSFSLRLSSGELILGCGGSIPYHTNDISVQCSDATLTISEGGKHCSVFVSKENELFPGFYDLHPQIPPILGAGGLDGYMQNALEDLLCSFKNNRQPQSSLQSALLAQQLMDDILAGAAQ